MKDPNLWHTNRTPKVTRPYLARLRVRQQQAVDMRLEGKTFRQIAEALGYASDGAAYNAVRHLLEKATVERADELRRVDGARLENLLGAIWARASAGDLDAIDSVLKILQQRARLFGLNKPVEVSVSGEVQQVVILQLGPDRPPRLIDLQNPDLATLADDELDVLRRLGPVIEGEARLLPEGSQKPGEESPEHPG